MEDRQIVNLYWERSETAIAETEKKYGRYCHAIAYNILESFEDSEECVNDTYLRAWNAIPPARPQRLSTYLGKITRHLALDCFDRMRAQKRQKNTALALDELAECIPDPATSGHMADEIALRDSINRFLASLPRKPRILFMRRYWYLYSVRQIAEGMRMSEGTVKVLLMRTRIKLKEHLEREEILL